MATRKKTKRTDLRKRKGDKRTARQQLGKLVTRTKVIASNRARTVSRTVGRVVRHPVRSAKRGARAVGSGARKLVHATNRTIHRVARAK